MLAIMTEMPDKVMDSKLCSCPLSFSTYTRHSVDILLDVINYTVYSLCSSQCSAPNPDNFT